jgi:hypothetical protein
LQGTRFQCAGAARIPAIDSRIRWCIPLVVHTIEA